VIIDKVTDAVRCDAVSIAIIVICIVSNAVAVASDHRLAGVGIRQCGGLALHFVAILAGVGECRQGHCQG